MKASAKKSGITLLPTTTKPVKASKVNLTPAQRFKKHTAKQANGCVLWTAGKSRNGYGLFDSKLAHRYAYELKYGEGSASGRYCLHKCDTPACVNTAHLRLGSAADNSRDMVKKGRSCKGMKKPVKRFTSEERSTIIQLFLTGSTQYEIAQQFSRADSTIANVLAPYKTKPYSGRRPKLAKANDGWAGVIVTCKEAA